MEFFVLCFKQLYQLLVKDVEVKVTIGSGVLCKHFGKPMFAFRCTSLSKFAGIAHKQCSTLLACFTASTAGIIRCSRFDANDGDCSVFCGHFHKSWLYLCQVFSDVGRFLYLMPSLAVFTYISPE